MKLLIITQKVNKSDPILGFFCRWIEEFSKQVSELYVICLERGEYNFNENVRVISLGKDQGISKFRILLNFYKSILSLKNEYDVVFVHMNPIYIVLGGFLWRIFGKSIALWYMHKTVDFKLKIAEKFCDVIFTASEKSFRIRSNKVKIVGHGIDTDLFKPIERRDGHDKFRVINVGRITPVKNQLRLVQLLDELKRSDKKVDVVLEIVGAAAVESDFEYLNKIKKYIKENDLEPDVKLAGPLDQRELVGYYNKADLLVNLSETGSLDKDVLEAAACNVDVLTSNEAFAGVLPKEYLADMDDEKILEAIRLKISDRSGLGKLRGMIVKNHNLNSLINVIAEELKKYVRD